MTWDQGVFIVSVMALVISVVAFVGTVPLAWTWRDLGHATRVAVWSFKNYAQLCGLKATLSDPATYSPFPPSVHADTVRNIITIYMEDFPDAP